MALGSHHHFMTASIRQSSTYLDCHVLPRLLGDGTHLYDLVGGSMRKLQNLVGDDPNVATNLRFRTTYQS